MRSSGPQLPPDHRLPGVLRVTYAFARQPSIATERGKGAARVLRDAYAEAWQVSARACAQCPDECREMAGLPPRPPVPPGRPVPEGELPKPCVDPQGLARFADASPTCSTAPTCCWTPSPTPSSSR